MNPTIDIAQALATLMACICLGMAAPHLLWRSWLGLGLTLTCALCCYAFPGGAAYWLLLGLVLSCVFLIRAMHREMAG